METMAPARYPPLTMLGSVSSKIRMLTLIIFPSRNWNFHKLLLHPNFIQTNDSDHKTNGDNGEICSYAVRGSVTAARLHRNAPRQMAHADP